MKAPSLPFRMGTDDDCFSTSSSAFRSKETFIKRLQTSYKQLPPMSPPPLTARHNVSYMSRARSNSPRMGLEVVQRDCQLFPSNQPVMPQRDPAWECLSGLNELQPSQEEDEDLKRLKERYASMVDSSELHVIKKKTPKRRSRYKAIAKKAQVAGM